MKGHHKYVEEQMKKSPTFAKEFEEARRELTLAVELAQLRERRGLSQTEVAKLAGMQQSQIARVERGIHLPAVNTLLKLLTVLGGKLELGPNHCRVIPVHRKVLGFRRRQYA